MYRTIDTIHEYRLRYPDTAAVPTLTQSGLLGLLLAVQDRKAAEAARAPSLVETHLGRSCERLWPYLADAYRSRIPSYQHSGGNGDSTSRVTIRSCDDGE